MVRYPDVVWGHLIAILGTVSVTIPAVSQTDELVGGFVRVHDVTRPPGVFASGLLVRMSADSLFVRPDSGGPPEAIALIYVSGLERRLGRVGSGRKGFVWGALGGGLIGSVSGALTANQVCRDERVGVLPIRFRVVCEGASPPARAGVFGVAGTIAGAMIGWIAGTRIEKWAWQPIWLDGMRASGRVGVRVHAGGIRVSYRM